MALPLRITLAPRLLATLTGKWTKFHADGIKHLGCRAAGLALCALIEAACSGGGGVGSSAAPTAMSAAVTQAPSTSGVAINLQPAKTTVAYQAASTSATVASTGIGGVTITPAGQGETITISTDSSGNLSGVAIPSGGIHHTLSGAGAPYRSLSSSDTLYNFYILNDALYDLYSGGYSLSQVAASQTLSSSAYGFWATTLQPPSHTGTFAFGNATPAASVPSVGSATFNGSTMGVGGMTDGSAAFAVNGSVQVIANFATQTVTTNLTAFSAVNACYTSSAKASLPDLNGTSTMTGNSYAGSIVGGALTGTINGNFYGPAAQETAGVWQASGGGTVWIGSYGAK